MSAAPQNRSAPQGHKDLPMQLYLQVFGALVALTAVSVGMSYIDLGPNSIYAALVIAFVQAALLVGFFMHLRYAARFHQLVFFGSLIFVATMFGFTFVDLTTRDAVLPEQGNFALSTERENARRLAELPQPQATPQATQQPGPSPAPAAAAPAAEPRAAPPLSSPSTQQPAPPPTATPQP